MTLYTWTVLEMWAAVLEAQWSLSSDKRGSESVRIGSCFRNVCACLWTSTIPTCTLSSFLYSVPSELPPRKSLRKSGANQSLVTFYISLTAHLSVGLKVWPISSSTHLFLVLSNPSFRLQTFYLFLYFLTGPRSEMGQTLCIWNVNRYAFVVKATANTIVRTIKVFSQIRDFAGLTLFRA